MLSQTDETVYFLIKFFAAKILARPLNKRARQVPSASCKRKNSIEIGKEMIWPTTELNQGLI